MTPIAGNATPAGEIVGTDGAVLGEHPGIHRYTVGQRRGLGINNGAAKTFVLEIDAPANRIVVGPEEMLGRSGLEAEDVRWVAGCSPERIDAVQVRAHGGVAAAGLLAASKRICGFAACSGTATSAHVCDAPAVHDIVVLVATPGLMLPAPEKTGAATVTLNALVWPAPAVSAELPLKATASTT